MHCSNCENDKMKVMTTKVIPGWAIAVSIIFFPIGLLSLLAKKEKQYFFCDNCETKWI